MKKEIWMQQIRGANTFVSELMDECQWIVSKIDYKNFNEPINDLTALTFQFDRECWISLKFD